MSESVVGGAAVAVWGAVGTCGLLLVGAAAGVAYLVAQGLTWLSEQAQKELERLDKELPPVPVQLTTKEAREAFERTFQKAQAKAAKIPALKAHAKTLATALALQKSPLGAFVSQSEWGALVQPRPSQRCISQVLKKASRSFTQATARAVNEAIVETGALQGFCHRRRQVESQGRRLTVLEDSEGRALIAEVREAAEGAIVTLDLTGFGDGACHGAMEGVLKGLAAKGVSLKGSVRRSHYRREGVLAKTVSFPQEKAKKAQAVHPAQSHSAEERRLKHSHYWTNQRQVKTRR